MSADDGNKGTRVLSEKERIEAEEARVEKEISPFTVTEFDDTPVKIQWLEAEEAQ